MIEISASDFCDSVRDGTHDSPKPVEGHGKPLVTTKHMKGGRVSIEDAYLISEADFEKINQRSQVHQWDVLISMIGTLGELVLVKDEPTYAIKNIGLFKTKSKYDGLWLYYYLQSPKAKNHMHTSAQGSTQQYLSLKTLRGFPLLVPDSETDKRAICEVLKTIDDKIKLNQKMNQTLEEIAKAIFKSWFVDFDPVRAKAEGRPTGLPPEISDLFPDELVGSENGEIPRGWDQESIYEFCTVEYGAPFKSKLFNEKGLGKPLIRIRDLPKGKSAVFTEEIHPKGRLIKAGDLVVGMDGEFRCYLWQLADSWMNQRVCKFVPKEGIPSAFVWFALERPLHFIESTEVATTVIHLGKGDIDDFQFTQSSNELLNVFGKITNPMLEKIILAGKEIEVLSKLRDTLLPKLISGELRIPDAEKFLEEAGI